MERVLANPPWAKSERILISFLLLTFLIVPNVFAEDPSFYVKKGTWQDTMLASREALMKAENAPGSPTRYPDFGTDDFTISAWIRTTDTTGAIVSRAVALGAWSPQGKTFLVKDGKLAFAAGRRDVLDTGVSVNDGQWHHVVVTGIQPLEFYVDGKLVKTGTIDNVRPDKAGHDFTVGWCSFNFPGELDGFDGDIDEVRIYNRRLSASEVSGLGRDPTTVGNGLAGWWRFDDGAVDSSENFNDGSSTNAVPTEGKFGSAMHFNGQSGVMLPPVPGGRTREKILELVKRDFTDDASTQEMAWEQEDAIWTTDWFDGGLKELAGRYAGACKDIAGSPEKARNLAGMVKTAKDLGAVREIYHFSRRNDALYLTVKGRVDLMLEELDYLQELHTADDTKWNEYKKAVRDVTARSKKTLNAVASGDEAAVGELQSEMDALMNVHGNLPHKLPSGVDGPARFGAVYSKLKYTLEWDRRWRVSEDADVVVQFNEGPYKFVFWRGCSYIPCWVTEHTGPWFTNEFFERRGWLGGGDSMMEPMSDKQCRYSHVRVVENNDARVVVHWRYNPTDLNYNLAYIDKETGWGDWADEYWTIYPDGIAMREATLFSSGPNEDWVEYQESIFINQPGTRPSDNIPWEAVTLANLDGETHSYKWERKFPPEFKKPASPCIQLVNFRTKYKQFSVVTPEELRVSAYPKDPRFKDSEYFNTWDAWPVSQDWSDARKATNFNKVSHSNLTHIRWKPYVETPKKRTWLMLTGMTDKKAGELAPLARSWLRAPKLKLSGSDFASEGYDPPQRAYVLTCNKAGQPSPLSLQLEASKNSPVVNPAFVIKNWGGDGVSLKINGKKIERGKDFRFGHRHRFRSSDLVVWVKVESIKPIQISLLPVTGQR